MDYPISHYFLVRSQTATLSGQHVRRYLAGNQLITYAEFFVREGDILNAEDQRFWPLLEQGLEANLAFTARMIDHLKDEGIVSLDQLAGLAQGYATKVFHTLAHMVDGFIGVDSVFYNLIEDSHQVSAPLATSIRNAPGEFWLVPVRTGRLQASVLHKVA